MTTQFVPHPGRGHRRQALAVIRRGLREFGAVPLLLIAAFGMLAVVSILGDQAHVPGLDAVRGG